MRKLRDDVVLEKVSGVHLLVALRSAWGECPFVMQIAPFAAFFWKAMRDGLSDDQVIDLFSREMNRDQEKAQRAFAYFIKAAEANHYLLPEDET